MDDSRLVAPVFLTAVAIVWTVWAVVDTNFWTVFGAVVWSGAAGSYWWEYKRSPR